jgi:TIR domain
MSQPAIEIFFSYARKDELLRDELAKHLKPLRQEGIIRDWHDREIPPGAEWQNEIDRHLESAQIILLLISADFLASDYCYGFELKRALERHESNEACVIPVILRSCDWQKTKFGKLAALPTDWTLDIFRFVASQIYPLANNRRIDSCSCKDYDKLSNDRSFSFSRFALFYH